MPLTYDDCDGATYQLIKNVMAQYHQPLVDAGVTIHAIFVRKEDENGDGEQALKHHGYSAAAKIQVTSLQDRARGVADAKLTIDHFLWDRYEETRRIALIDHELYHLVVQSDDNGVKYDDRMRPKKAIESPGAKKALRQFAESTLGAGIDSITLSAPGRDDVTITKEDAARMRGH